MAFLFLGLAYWWLAILGVFFAAVVGIMTL